MKEKRWLTNNCVDCDILISAKSLRCKPCNGKHKSKSFGDCIICYNPLITYGSKMHQECYLNEKRNDKNFCIDCNIEISSKSTRCVPCNYKNNSGENNCMFGRIGELHHNYKTDAKSRCPICKGEKDCRAETCQKCRKIFTQLVLPNCTECGKKLKKYNQNMCQECYRKWQKENPELQSNYIDGKSIRNCIDCNQPINGRSSTIQRCWDCEVHKRKTTPISDSTRRKLSEHAKKMWSNKEFKIKTLKKIRAAFKISFNKAEQKLFCVLQTILKNEYKFVGDYQISIQEFCPDFIGMKKTNRIIELYGDYWHNLPEYIERDKRRLSTYNKEGYKTLIVWEHELKDLDLLVGKILEFHNEE